MSELKTVVDELARLRAEFNKLRLKADQSIFPVGFITFMPHNALPPNWLICDGSDYKKEAYGELAQLYGTLFGAPADTSLFRLPNVKGKMVVSRDPGDTSFDVIGETGGAKTKTLSTAELAQHNHTFLQRTMTADQTHSHTEAARVSAGSTKAPTGGGTFTSDNAGSGTAFSIMNPYIVFYAVCRAF